MQVQLAEFVAFSQDHILFESYLANLQVLRHKSKLFIISSWELRMFFVPLLDVNISKRLVKMAGFRSEVGH